MTDISCAMAQPHEQPPSSSSHDHTESMPWFGIPRTTRPNPASTHCSETSVYSNIFPFIEARKGTPAISPGLPTAETMSSRAHTPDSPTCSSLTSTHEDEGEQFDELCNYETSMAEPSSDMQNELDQYAQETPADDTSQTLPSEQVGDDRAAEFEEATARERQATRENTARASTGHADGEDPLTGHEDNEDSQQRGNEAADGGEDLLVENAKQAVQQPNSELNSLAQARPEAEAATSPRVQASWVSDAVSACRMNKKV